MEKNVYLIFFKLYLNNAFNCKFTGSNAYTSFLFALIVVSNSILFVVKQFCFFACLLQLVMQDTAIYRGT